MSGHDGWLSFLKGAGGAFNFTYGGEKVPVAPQLPTPPTTTLSPPPPSATGSGAGAVAAKLNSGPRLNTMRRLRGGKRRGGKRNKRRTNKNK
jgi:hypothetical protein